MLHAEAKNMHSLAKTRKLYQLTRLGYKKTCQLDMKERSLDMISKMQPRSQRTRYQPNTKKLKKRQVKAKHKLED
jgi:hypothetical protein